MFEHEHNVPGYCMFCFFPYRLLSSRTLAWDSGLDRLEEGKKDGIDRHLRNAAHFSPFAFAHGDNPLKRGV